MRIAHLQYFTAKILTKAANKHPHLVAGLDDFDADCAFNKHRDEWDVDVDAEGNLTMYSEWTGQTLTYIPNENEWIEMGVENE